MSNSKRPCNYLSKSRATSTKANWRSPAHALAQAEEIVTELAKRQARDEPQN